MKDEFTNKEPVQTNCPSSSKLTSLCLNGVSSLTQPVLFVNV